MSERGKHTPGPWTYAETSCLVGGPDRLRIADTYCSERAAKRPEYGECQANARLIAAAPDLLEALEALTPILEAAESNASGRPEWPWVSKRINAARAAIDKARGAA